MKRLLILLTATLAACATAEPSPSHRQASLPPGSSIDGPNTGDRPSRFFASTPPPSAPTPTDDDPLGQAMERAERNERHRGGIDHLAVDGAPVGATARFIMTDVEAVSLLIDPEVAVRPSLPFVVNHLSWLDALKSLARVNDLALTIDGVTPLPPHLPTGVALVLATHERTTLRQARAKQSAQNSIDLLRAQRDAAKAKADTDALQPDAGLVVRSHQFRYADPEEALEYLKSLYRSGDSPLPNSREKDTPVATATTHRIRFALFAPENLLTVQAPPTVADEIIERIEALDVRPRQVYIEARIVEIQRNYLKDLGIEWGGYNSSTTNLVFPHNIGVTGGSTGTGNYPNVVSLPANSAIDPTTGQSMINPQGAALGVTIGSISGATLLSARLTALEQAGVSRTLSNPKVVAINGGQAVIKSGREIPYQSSSANLGTSVQFKEAVISLAVTPQILDNEQVRMRIVAKKDEVDPALSVQGIPAIKKKEITTDVVVASGSSAALGGVFEGVDNNRENKTPGFGDIPFIGRLFRSDHDEESQLELLVFITPTILNEEGRP